MGDPYVRPLGHVEGGDGEKVTIGIDREAVLVCSGPWLSADMATLTIEQADELVALLITAIMYAEQRAAALAGENSG